MTLLELLDLLIPQAEESTRKAANLGVSPIFFSAIRQIESYMYERERVAVLKSARSNLVQGRLIGLDWANLFANPSMREIAYSFLRYVESLEVQS